MHKDLIALEIDEPETNKWNAVGLRFTARTVNCLCILMARGFPFFKYALTRYSDGSPAQRYA